MLATALVGLMLMLSEGVSASPPPMQTALLSIGFVQAKLSDFYGTAEYPKRLADQQGFVSVTADFRGDGIVDQAGILRNVERGVAYIVVSSIRGKADTYVVKQMPLSNLSDVGLRVAAPLHGKAQGLTIFSLITLKSETFDLLDDNFVLRTGQ